jgi:hypothetical protein
MACPILSFVCERIPTNVSHATIASISTPPLSNPILYSTLKFLCKCVIFNEANGCFALETCPCIIRAQQKLRIETTYYGASLSRRCIRVVGKANICECTTVVFHEGNWTPFWHSSHECSSIASRFHHNISNI